VGKYFGELFILEFQVLIILPENYFPQKIILPENYFARKLSYQKSIMLNISVENQLKI